MNSVPRLCILCRMRLAMLLLVALVLAGNGAGAAAQTSNPSAHPPIPLSVLAFSETTEADSVLNPGRDDPWLAFDKVQHTTFSFLWTLGNQYMFVNKAEMRERQALPVSVATTAAIGVAKEIYDWRVGPTRYFSTRDLVADLVGIAAGVLVILY